MKKLAFMMGLLFVVPAMAEVDPAYFYQDETEYTDTDYADEDVLVDGQTEDVTQIIQPAAVVAPTVKSPRDVSNRTTASRAVVSGDRQQSQSGRNAPRTSRAVAARTTTRGVVSQPSSTRATTSRAVRSAQPGQVVRRARPGTVQAITSRKTSSSGTPNVARSASLLQTDTVHTPLYNGARVGIRGVPTIAARIPSVRVSSRPEVSQASQTSPTSEIDELAQLTDFCKAQYTQCMDDFCNVLDDNQGRCSCSANLKNYQKSEDALKQATEKLKDVAQKIQYIGLTAGEIETLFAQTEAELAMNSAGDSSQIKNDLDSIKSMIVDVSSGHATSDANSGISLDFSGLLDFTIDSTGFDLAGLLGGAPNTSSISNQRGDQLYKTATARCKAAVLNKCSTQGVDVSVIANTYDLEIDKQCIAYERSLSDANDQMKATVRNAQSVLQKARLLVAQQKNTYDLRGCVNALDACMQDDFVCGNNYENCLDPTGKYIVNGEVVVGSKPGVPNGTAGLYETWNKPTSPWAENGSVASYVELTVLNMPIGSNEQEAMSKFLQNKIGYNDDGKNYGMCMSVLNKCQDLTYTGTGQNRKYNSKNQVVKEYLQRTFVQIKNSQDEVLSEYAETCVANVISCLTKNGYSGDPTAQTLAISACDPVMTTCMSVNKTNDDVFTDKQQFARSIIPVQCNSGYYLPKDKTSCDPCTPGNYCPGGAFSFNSKADGGLIPCGDGKYSASGSASPDDCHQLIEPISPS